MQWMLCSDGFSFDVLGCKSQCHLVLRWFRQTISWFWFLTADFWGLIGKPQLCILWSRDSLDFKRLYGNSSWNYVVYILNCRLIYPISSLDGTISLIETKLSPSYLMKSIFSCFLWDLFSKAEESSQVRAVS